jgi:hypothetical protein
MKFWGVDCPIEVGIRPGLSPSPAAAKKALRASLIRGRPGSTAEEVDNE